MRSSAASSRSSPTTARSTSREARSSSAMCARGSHPNGRRGTPRRTAGGLRRRDREGGRRGQLRLPATPCASRGLHTTRDAGSSLPGPARGLYHPSLLAAGRGRAGGELELSRGARQSVVDLVLEPGAGSFAPSGDPCRASSRAAMRTILNLTATLYEDLVERLREPHAFAGERVAFLKCR